MYAYFLSHSLIIWQEQVAPKQSLDFLGLFLLLLLLTRFAIGDDHGEREEDGGGEDQPDEGQGQRQPGPVGADGLVNHQEDRGPEKLVLPRERVPVKELPDRGEGPEDEEDGDEDLGLVHPLVQPHHVHHAHVEGHGEVDQDVDVEPHWHCWVVFFPMLNLKKAMDMQD